jgi:hypothetical protein
MEKRPPLINPATVAVAKQLAEHVGRVHRVAHVLQSLGGHLHGEYALHAVARDRPGDVRLMQCTIPAPTMKCAAGVLAACGLEVTTVAADVTGVRLLVGDKQALGVDLTPHFFTGAPLQALMPPSIFFFDWQMLAVSRDGVYVKRDGGARTLQSLQHPQQSPGILALLERARRGMFCLTAECGPSTADDAGARQHGQAMCRALRMVLDQGWRMDDLLGGRRAWLVSRWDRLSASRTHATSDADADISDYSAFWMDGLRVTDARRVAKADGVCPICHDDFRPLDVVVNLPCNHNFHAACHGRPHGEHGGLCAWLEAGRGTCPCCRALVSAPPAPTTPPTPPTPPVVAR